MNHTTFSPQAMLQHFGVWKHLQRSTPSTPLVPPVGQRRGGNVSPTQQQPSAFSISFPGDMPDTRSLLNFAKPDVPVGEKEMSEQGYGSENLLVPGSEESMEHPYTSSNSLTPRFRSALEQVSYYTNESAEKRWK